MKQTTTTTATQLQNKVVLITGAASGLGAALGRLLAAEGALPVLADMNTQRLQQVVEAFETAGFPHMAVTLDVGDEAAVSEALTRILERFGRLDAVVNSAAIDVTVPIDELPVSDWERILRTNLTGPFIVARAAVPIMRRQGGGHIINIASTASKRAWPNAVGYHASKWGLLGLSHALHAELRPLGIKVSAVVAGGMRTPFLLDRFPDIDTDVLQDPANVARTICFVLQQPEETVIPEVMVLPMRETSWP